MDPLWRESVSHAEMGVQEAPMRARGGQLDPELAYEHVDRAVAVGHGGAPHQPIDLRPRDHAVIALGEHVEGLELSDRQAHPTPFDQELKLSGTDLEVAGPDDRGG